MKLSHIVAVTIESGAVADVERTYSARVSLVKGARDELEVEWLDNVGDLDDAELVAATEWAEGLYWGLLHGLDSEADEAADAHMARCKEEREL